MIAMPADTLGQVISAALQLGAGQVPGWSRGEAELARAAPAAEVGTGRLRELIAAGEDPLGDAFCRIRGPRVRRPLGQTFTPLPIVNCMADWAAGQRCPERVIDPGTGSARFLLAAGRRFPQAQLLGMDVDPVAAIIARGNLAAAGLARRARVEVADYRGYQPGTVPGATLYLGNPPYVRHHQIGARWKEWLTVTARSRGFAVSQLAGLHAHFFLATAEHAVAGDYGSFITSAEWLDVNYGALVRELLLEALGGDHVHVLEATAMPFADAAATGAVTCFHVGTRPPVLRLRRVRSVPGLGDLTGGRAVPRARLAQAARWGPLTRNTPKLPAGFVELGELCRVHRGAVTGANHVWITQPGRTGLPGHVLFPSVTRARELLRAGPALAGTAGLKLVIDLPADLDELGADDRKAVDRFLRRARQAGAADGYVARNRPAWWRVGLREPAPLLATYMARRPPAFVRNDAAARHVNIAHGIYPREPLPPAVIDAIARHLRLSVTVSQGRTYAGGLTKFEPKEVERLPVPAPPAH